ncbi:rRNA (guanine-N1)-methyltransferase [Shewanella sp. OPT22]|nr:rRNA (guanine-N1)-methyltransferase [Shewanella sp. OPT22]
MKVFKGLNLSQLVIRSFLISSLLTGSFTFADDTELYVTSGGARSDLRPQILIIFDNSNSMNRTQDEKTFFDRDRWTLTPNTKVYFSTTNEVPTPDSEQYFLHIDNRCHASSKYLNDYGLFTGFVRHYNFVGEVGSWRELTGATNSSVTHVDCFEDIHAKDYENNYRPNGFPADNLSNFPYKTPYNHVGLTSTETEIDQAHEQSLLTKFGVGKPANLYTEYYVNWYHDNSIADTTYKRIDIATRAIENVIVTTPAADIGLAIFNDRNEEGGRIISGIKENTDDNKSTLLRLITELETEGTTPLCETLYETYRYFSGQSVKYGDNSSLTPIRDTSIEINGFYDSPLKQCQKDVHVIIITDGFPFTDDNADSEVLTLPGISQDHFLIAEKDNRPTLLPNLSAWLANNDINPNVDGKQIAITNTIGFSDAAENAQGVLEETALSGGGKYASANDTKALQAAITALVNVALENGNSFTSPAVASNNFDRTRTLNSVYYAMFHPNEGPRWSGNLKKFSVTSEGVVVDKNDDPALEINGTIRSDACSIWTADTYCGDGNDVSIGGAASKVKDKLESDTGRKLLMNFSSGIDSLNKDNAQSQANGSANLATYMGANEAELDNLFNWIEGRDVDDENGDESHIDSRIDIIGDPLHSRPLAINFSSSEDETDVRILMGTNHGFMHMFKDAGESLEESWAFMPYELLPNVAELRANVPTGVHTVYGLDSPPASYVERSGSSISNVWVFFGMRRGGNSYYALDISAPDTPSLLWKKSPSDWGSELGQTWSEPAITKVPGHDGPVLIIGAGYAPETKDLTGVGQADVKGRGVFIIDAATGNVLHHFGRGNGESVTAIPSMEHSIPSAIAILDSDADGKTDRLYATDTGGNVWRMDMPSANKSTWSAFKFAQLGGNTVDIDRRFFSEPAVAQTVIRNTVNITAEGHEGSQTVTQNIPYDAVVVGSGLRPSPNNTQRTDMFFTLQDRNVNTQTYNAENTPNTLTIDDLYPITTGSPDTDNERVAFARKYGWYYQFGSLGEKSLSAATIIDGRVFFSSFVPSTGGENQCSVGGEGRIYALDLHFGKRTFYRNGAEYKTVEGIPDTPQVIVPGNSDGDGSGDTDNPNNQNDTLNKYIIGETQAVGEVQRVKSYYYYVEENN